MRAGHRGGDDLSQVLAHYASQPIRLVLELDALHMLAETLLKANGHMETVSTGLLLDEPFAGVDPIAVGDIQNIVHHLKERGIGVLITDHNVRETLSLCVRAYILAEGRVIAEGAPDALLANETVRRVYLGEQFRL